MAFDETLPSNSTKIRNYPTVLTDNFAAQVEGDATYKPQAINFDNRTPLAVSNDPTAIASAVIQYCKDDAAGNEQLFAIDPSSVIYQLTGQKYTETTNAGSAGGTLYKVELPALEDRVVLYSGLTSSIAVTTSGIVTYPEAFSTVYFVYAYSPAITTVLPTLTSAAGSLTILSNGTGTYRWIALGRI